MFGFFKGGGGIEGGPDDIRNFFRSRETQPPHSEQKEIERIILAWMYHDFMPERRAQELLKIVYNGTYEEIEAVKRELLERANRAGLVSFDKKAHRPVNDEDG